MDFEYSPKVKEMQAKLLAFMDEHVYPNENTYYDEVAANRAKGNAWVPTKIIEELKPKARAAGLWNLFLPKSPRAPEGLSNLEYAPLCEIMGRVPWAPEVFNCSAPDTGNMETIERYGTEADLGAEQMHSFGRWADVRAGARRQRGAEHVRWREHVGGADLQHRRPVERVVGDRRQGGRKEIRQQRSARLAGAAGGLAGARQRGADQYLRIAAVLLRGGDALEHVRLHFSGKLRTTTHAFQALGEPVALAGIDDVHELGTDGATICLLQCAENFT